MCLKERDRKQKVEFHDIDSLKLSFRKQFIGQAVKTKLFRSSESNDFVIGVTIIKAAESPGQYINIYSEWEPGTKQWLDSDRDQDRYLILLLAEHDF